MIHILILNINFFIKIYISYFLLMKNKNYAVEIFYLIEYIEKRNRECPTTIGYYNNKKDELNDYLKKIKEKVLNGQSFTKNNYKKIISNIETVYLLPYNI